MYNEVKRALILRSALEIWFEEYDSPPSVSELDEEDWNYLLAYENALAPVVEAAKLLAGELYPTESSLIPFLDQILIDLGELALQLTGDSKSFVVRFIRNLKTTTPARFPMVYKDRSPYNTLTALDVRYGGLYIDSPDLVENVYDELKADISFEDDRTAAVSEGDPEDETTANADVEVENESVVPVNRLERRRAQLKAAKEYRPAETEDTENNKAPTFQEKLREKLYR